MTLLDSLPRYSQIHQLILHQLPAFLSILLLQLLVEFLPHIPHFPSILLQQCLVPPHTDRIARVEKPIRHLIRTAPPPVRDHLFRLHILEPGLFEILLDLLGSRPVRISDDRGLEPGVHFQAGVGPGDRNARVLRVDPGIDA